MGGREKERERLTGCFPHNPTRAPTQGGSEPKMKVCALDWKSNLGPFSEWDDALTIEKHWLGQQNLFLNLALKKVYKMEHLYS